MYAVVYGICIYVLVASPSRRAAREQINTKLIAMSSLLLLATTIVRSRANTVRVTHMLIFYVSIALGSRYCSGVPCFCRPRRDSRRSHTSVWEYCRPFQRREDWSVCHGDCDRRCNFCALSLTCFNLTLNLDYRYIDSGPCGTITSLWLAYPFCSYSPL